MPDDLRKLAEAATPGPWEVYADGNISICAELTRTPEGRVAARWIAEVDEMNRADFEECCGSDEAHADAMFIAAANPLAVLALLNERDEARRERDRLKEALRFYADRGNWDDDYTCGRQVAPGVWEHDGGDVARAALRGDDAKS